ncbi:MAG: VWA domain-containing protein [Methanothrix sp.]|nr:VWA domain-containing protein [Methanothrix sp.]
MIKYMMILLIILLSVNIITTEKAQGQSMPNSPASGVDNAAYEDSGIRILGIDSTGFPKIRVTLFIDKFCAIVGNLKKENFKVKEGGNEIAIDNFYFSGNASGQKLDLAVVFDDSGSMGKEISAMKSEVKNLINTLQASGIGAKYSLVSFKDRISVTINWTDDPEAFEKKVNALREKGGSDEPEVSLDAIEAILAMGFRPDAQKVILVITDAHAHYRDDGSAFSKHTKEEIEKDLLESGVTFIPISPAFDKSSSYVDLREISNNIQSIWIDINSADFTTILEQIKGILTETYVIEYTSPDQPPSENRIVLVSADAHGCLQGSASDSYTIPGSVSAAFNAPPVINDLISDKTTPQEAGTAVTWTANAIDPESDPILYQFWLRRSTTDNALTVVQNWSIDNQWTWMNDPNDAGGYKVFVYIRDGKHAPETAYDSAISRDYTLTGDESIGPNSPPIINSLWGVNWLNSSQIMVGTNISWYADVSDPDGDQVLYRFFLNDRPMTDWISESSWTWTPTDAGSYVIVVHVRDGKHADPNRYDDSKEYIFVAQNSIDSN